MKSAWNGATAQKLSCNYWKAQQIQELQFLLKQSMLATVKRNRQNKKKIATVYRHSYLYRYFLDIPFNMSPGFSVFSNYGHQEKHPWGWVMLQRRETGVKTLSRLYIPIEREILIRKYIFNGFVCWPNPLLLRFIKLKFFLVVHFHFWGTSSWNYLQLLGTELTKYFKRSSASPAFLLNSDVLEMVSLLPLLLLFLLHISGGFRSSCRPSNMVF